MHAYLGLGPNQEMDFYFQDCIFKGFLLKSHYLPCCVLILMQNAYNEPAQINPTSLAGGDTRNGLECGTPTCTIPNLSTVCQDGNYYAGPDNACINIDGTGSTETASVDLFKNACPEAFAWSTETGVTYACNTGSNYDAIWCP